MPDVGGGGRARADGSGTHAEPRPLQMACFAAGPKIRSGATRFLGYFYQKSVLPLK
jgi:hypothetical protein